MSAEYLLAGGNGNVILLRRGAADILRPHHARPFVIPPAGRYPTCRFWSIPVMGQASAIMCRPWHWPHWPPGPTAS